jgi:hypothetical protein
MRYASMIAAVVLALVAHSQPAHASKPLVSPALYVNPNDVTDSLLCIVTNISTNPLSVDVAILDGTGSTAYCGVTSITLAPGALEGVPCATNPNNFASYCQVSSKHNSSIRANHCLVDSSNTIKFCTEAR